MAINIDTVYQLCYSICAKQAQAFPSPNDFNSYAALANIDLFNYYNDERQKMLLKVKSGQELFNPNVLVSFVVNEFVMSPSSPSPSLPANFAYDEAFKTTINGINANIAKVDYNKLENYLNSTIDAPTATKPIYVQLPNNLNVYPTLNTPTYLTYYRYPTTPVWGYTLVNGRPQYSAVASTNFEFDGTELMRIATRILKYMGISIRDEELVKIADQMLNTSS